MAFERVPEITRDWVIPTRTTPAFFWDVQDSAAVQTRWDADTTSWDILLVPFTLWDLDIATVEIWVRQ